MRHKVQIFNIGKIKYKDAWNLQKQYVQSIQKDLDRKVEPHHKLLLLEHFPVYTTGLRSHVYSLEEEERLKALGADFYRTNRGGLITFHGPGQLVAYPILALGSFSKGIKWYVASLEKTVVECCKNLGIKAKTTSDTGIWVGNKKICALGIHGRRVSSHGIALNCDIDLSWYEHIVPCGLEGKGVTSVTKELGRKYTVNDVLPHFLEAFSEEFNADLILSDKG